MKKNKILWHKPKCSTIEKEQINKTIVAAACSKYIGTGCNPYFAYIDSIPGKPIDK